MISDPQKLATLVARNVQATSSDITIEEIKEIIALYVRLYNKFYENKIEIASFIQKAMQIYTKIAKNSTLK